MSRREPFLPYQQGHLDGLCGIYAIINALRLALKDTPADRLCEEDWGELFHTLLAAADRSVGAVKVAAAGIEPKPLWGLVKLAARHMADQHDVPIEVSRPFKAKKRTRRKNLVRQLAAINHQPGSALVICLSGYLEHWTVVRKVGPTTLELSQRWLAPGQTRQLSVSS